tara:strand:- start:1663 stop:2103 length:441 start_codon:yes stop_codon:yes gene_type:complete
MKNFTPQFFFAEGCSHSISLLQLLKAANIADSFEMVNAGLQLHFGVVGTPALRLEAGDPYLYGDHAFDWASNAAAAANNANTANTANTSNDVANSALPPGNQAPGVTDNIQAPVAVTVPTNIEQNTSPPLDVFSMFDCQSIEPRKE